MYFLIVSGWNLKTSRNKPKLIRVRIKLHFKQLHRPLKKLFLKLSLKICPIDLFSIVDHKRLITNTYFMVSMTHTNQTIFRTLHAPTLLPTISPILQPYFSIAFDFFLKFVYFSKFLLIVLLIVGKNVNRS